jgi:hypothetical protein
MKEPTVTICPPFTATPDDQIRWKRDYRQRHKARQPLAEPAAERPARREPTLLKPTGERVYTGEPRRCFQCNREYVPRSHLQKYCADACLEANHAGQREAATAWFRKLVGASS